MTEKNKKAVALRYPQGADAPFISAKAEGYAAEQLLKIAEENGIPVVEDADMAEILSIQNIGQYIPEETYSAIAMIFAFIAKIS